MGLLAQVFERLKAGLDHFFEKVAIMSYEPVVTTDERKGVAPGRDFELFRGPFF